MRKFLFFFVISLLAFPSLGQEVIKGRVVDVGTRESLREVQVQSSFSEKTTFTNDSGYFFIPINHLPSDLNLPLSYAVHNNTLFWDFAQKVKIVIFSTGGQILLSTSQNKTGKLKLPIPSVGYYGLHISGGEKEYIIATIALQRIIWIIKAAAVIFSTPNIIIVLINF